MTCAVVRCAAKEAVLCYWCRKPFGSGKVCRYCKKEPPEIVL